MFVRNAFMRCKAFSHEQYILYKNHRILQRIVFAYDVLEIHTKIVYKIKRSFLQISIFRDINSKVKITILFALEPICLKIFSINS